MTTLQPEHEAILSRVLRSLRINIGWVSGLTLGGLIGVAILHAAGAWFVPAYDGVVVTVIVCILGVFVVEESLDTLAGFAEAIDREWRRQVRKELAASGKSARGRFGPGFVRERFNEMVETYRRRTVTWLGFQAFVTFVAAVTFVLERRPVVLAAAVPHALALAIRFPTARRFSHWVDTQLRALEFESSSRVHHDADPL